MRGRALLVTSVVAAAAAAAVAIPASSAPVGPVAPKPSQPIGTQCPVFPAADGVAAGAPSLPDQRMWNQDISGAPVDPNSDAIMAGIRGASLHPDFGRPAKYGIPYVVSGGKKAVKVKFTAYGNESDKGKYKIPLKSPIEGGKNGDGDRHTIGFADDECKLYELYRAFPDKKRKRWKAESGAIWDLNSAGLRREGWTSADAAGLPIFPGLVRYEEVAAGAVNHAIRITFAKSRDAYIRPATHCAGSTDDASVVAMGQRLRMKASYDLSGITGQARPIAEAMKKYGFVVADNGSDWFFSGTSDPRFDVDSLNQLKEIPGSAFEVVATQDAPVTC